jgi:Cu/Ag efflux pump CusA
MIPIALEWAIGLERLSPLAIVAIGGLMVSTFLTLIYVPIIYSLLDELTEMVKKMLPYVHLSRISKVKVTDDAGR